MPLSINVGLSRKASKDYQSTGYSINVTAELDQSLLAKPDELQHQIDALYEQAQNALDRQAAVEQPPQTSSPRTTGRYDRQASNGNGGRGYRNGNSSGNGRGGGGPATDSQRRAINAIANRLGIDPHLEAREIIGADLTELTIRQASDLIDHMKQLEPAGHPGNENGRNGSRR